MVYGPGVLPMPMPSRRFPSMMQLTTMPPRPAIPAVPWAEMSNPASWLPIIVQPVTTSPSAPQSEMPKRLSSTWQAVIRMPRGGGHICCCSSMKMPLVPLPRAVHAVTVSRSAVPHPPLPIPAPPRRSPLSSRPPPADADPRPARLLAVVEPAAPLGQDGVDDRVLQEVAAEPGRGGVVHPDVPEATAQHVLQAQALGEWVVLVQVHARAVALEAGEGAVGQMIVRPGTVLRGGEPHQRGRGPRCTRVGQQEAGRGHPGAHQRDPGAPHRRGVLDAVVPRRHGDDPCPSVVRARVTEPIDQGGEGR